VLQIVKPTVNSCQAGPLLLGNPPKLLNLLPDLLKLLTRNPKPRISRNLGNQKTEDRRKKHLNYGALAFGRGQLKNDTDHV
jgi:hypothetical protein